MLIVGEHRDEGTKFLFIKGINQYGVLSYMLEAMAKELTDRGHIVHICEWNEWEKSKRKKWNVCMTCQAIDATFNANADKYVTWLMDYPIPFMERLMNHRDMNNLWIACVDQTHVHFLKEVMEFHNVFYLPHFGGLSCHAKDFENRKINVFSGILYRFGDHLYGKL